MNRIQELLNSSIEPHAIATRHVSQFNAWSWLFNFDTLSPKSAFNFRRQALRGRGRGRKLHPGRCLG